MALNKDYRISWGINCLLFGCILLLNYLGLIPRSVAGYVLRPEISVIIAGFIFLCFRKTRPAGIILILLGLFLCFATLVVGALGNIPMIVWIISLILLGVILLFIAK